MLSIMLTIIAIPVQIVLTVIVAKLDQIQDLAWILWFNRGRGKAARFFTRAFLLIWVASPDS